MDSRKNYIAVSLYLKIINMLGYVRTEEAKYIRKTREIGTSRWTLKKKINLVMDMLFSYRLHWQKNRGFLY